MTAHFEIQLLDRCRVLHEGVPVVLRQREQRLLCLLALRGSMSRRRLAGLLWPETTESRALDSLRVSLHHIHRQVPGLVCGADGWLELAETSQVDVHRFRARLEAWAADPDLGCAEVEELVHGAELLPDWDEHWLYEEQEQLRQLRAQVLEGGALKLLGAGQPRQAMALARAAVALNPISETSASVLALAEASGGNRASAAAGLLLFIDRLREDLGISPGEQVTRTLAQLRSG